MAGDETEIPLKISVTGDQAVSRATDTLAKFFDIVAKNERVLGKLPEGFRGVEKAAAQFAGLMRAIGGGSPAVSILNAMAREAKSIGGAVTQAEFERLKATPRLIQEIVREANPASLKKALEAQEQLLAKLRLQEIELAQLRARAERGTLGNSARDLKRTQAQLQRAEDTVRVLREELATARAQEAEDRGVASRARSARVGARFLNETPEGQIIAAQRALREEMRRTNEAMREQQRLAREAEAAYARSTAGRLASSISKAQGDAQFFAAANAGQDTFQAAVERNVQAQTFRQRVAAATREAMGVTPRTFDANAARQRRIDTYLGDGGAGMLELQGHLQLHYAMLNGLFTAYHDVTSAVVEFDKAMHELGAVSGASTAQLDKLQKVILDTSRNTPFAAKEVAAVATEMAQNGIPSGEIGKALPNIANLASATGAGLKEAADMFSSAFEVFKVRGAESAHIADQLTMALTHTRVSADKFAGALQSVSTTAASNGMTFAQTTAALGAMADQGLRSGTLLGTGLRQVLLDLETPPKKLAERFAELGISSEKLDVKTNGLVGVLQNLHDAGFTASDAFATMQSRSAQAFAALLNGSDDLKRLYDSMLLTSDAAAANAERMDTLAAKWSRLQNSLTALALGAGGPLLNALKATTGGLGSLASAAAGGGTALSVLGTVMAGIAGGTLLRWMGHLVSNLSVVRTSTQAVTGAMTALAEGETVAALAGRALTSALPFAALSAAITAVIWGLSSYESAASSITSKEDSLKDATDNATQAFQDKSKALESVDSFMESTIAREATLREHQDLLNTSVLEARNKFGDLSSAVFENISSYDQLIAKISEVREELRGGLLVDITRAKDAMGGTLSLQQGVIASHSGVAGVTGALHSLGVSTPSEAAAAAAASVGVVSSAGAPTLAEAMGAIPADLQRIPAVMQAFQALSTGDGRAAAQAYSALGSAPPAVAAKLKAALSPLIDAQRKIDQTNGKLAGMNSQEALVRLTQTSDYGRLQYLVNGLAPDVAALNHLNDQPIIAQRQATFQGAQQHIQGAVNSYMQMRQGLNSGDQAALDASPIGQRINELRAIVSQRSGEVAKAVAASRLTDAQLTEQASARILAEREGAVRAAKTPAGLTAAVNAVKSAAQDRYNAQVTMAEAGFQKRLAAGADPTSIARERGIVNAGYAAEMQQAIQRATDAHLHASTAAARPFNTYEANPVAAFQAEATNVDQAAGVSLSVAGRGVAYHRAFLSAAEQQKQFPKAILERERKQLAALDAAQAKLELETRHEQIGALTDITKRVAASIASTNQQIQALKDRYHLVEGENGQLTGTFPNAQVRSEVAARYHSLSHNAQSLGTFNQSLQTRISGLQTNAETLQGQIDATNAGSGGAAQLTAGDYVQAFMQKHNATGPVSQQALQLAQSAADGLTASFGKFFDIFVTGARRGQNVFREFSTSILRNMTQTLSNQVAASFLGLTGMALVGGPSNAAPGTNGTGGAQASGASPVGGVLGAMGMGAMMGGSLLGSISNFFMPSSTANVVGDGFGGVPMLAQGPSPFMSALSTIGSWFYDGGVVPLHFASGGMVPGANLGRDTVPAMLAGGEAVLNHRAVHMIGAGAINALNAGAIARNSGVAAPAPAQQHPPGQVNVWVVDKSTRPQLSPQDVMAIIGNDVMTGGPMKKLIKSVAMGG